MEECWHDDPEQRPDSSAVVKRLEALIEESEELNKRELQAFVVM